MTVGERGPVPIQDFVFLDDMSHFDRERIPERVVHAKGAGTGMQVFSLDLHFWLGKGIKCQAWNFSMPFSV